MTTTSHTVNINVTDNGTIAKVDSGVNKLHKDVKDLQRTASQTQAVQSSTVSKKPSSAMDYANDSKDYGVARGSVGTGAAGRDFAKQAQGLGGLVHVYATFAANLFAVSAAFTALSKAADTTNMVKGLDQLGAASGQALGSMAKNLTKITDGAISLRDAMTATAQATAGGLSGEQLTRLTVVAKNASQALGRDMPDALSRLTRGIVKIEPELLDELGIMTRVEKAQQDYARSLGKTATALTDFEKRQAFAVAAIAEGEKKFGAIQIDANPYSKLLASMTNLATAGLELMNKVLGPIVKLLAESPVALTAAMAGITTMLLSRAIPALGQWKQGLRAAADESARTSAAISENFKDFQMQSSYSAGRVLERDMKQAGAAADKAFAHVHGIVQETFGKSSATLKELNSEMMKGTNTVSAKALSNLEQQSKLSANKVSALNEELKTQGKLDAAHKEELAFHTARLAKMEQAVALAKLENAERAKSADLAVRSAAALDKAQAKLTREPGYFSEEMQRERIAKRAEQRSASRSIIANAGDNTQTMGMFSALGKLKEDINGSEVPLTKMNKGLTYLKGGLTIVSSAAMTLANSLMNVFMIIGLMVAVFQVLDSIFSKNGKQAAAFAAALDSVSSTAETLDSTLKSISEKDPLEQLNAQSTMAKANALKELATSLKSVSKTFQELSNQDNWWDKSVDWVKDQVGKGNQDKLAESMATSIRSTLDSIDDPDTRKKAQNEFSNLLGNAIDFSHKGLKSKIQSMSIGVASAAAKDVADKTKKIADEAFVAAKAQTELAESIDKSAKSAANFMNSYNPTDKKSLLELDQISNLNTFINATGTAEEGIKALNDSVSSFASISAFPPEMGQALIAHRDAIQGIGTKYAEASTGIRQYNNALAEKQNEKDVINADIDRLTKANTSIGNKGAGGYSEEINKLKLSLKDIDKEISGLNLGKGIFDGMKKDAIDAIKKINEALREQSYESMKKAYENLSAGLDRAKEAAGIGLGKAINSLMPGGPSAIAAHDLAMQELAMQQKMLDSDNRLIESMTALAIAFEAGQAEADLKKAEKDGDKDAIDKAKSRSDASAIVQKASAGGASEISAELKRIEEHRLELKKQGYKLSDAEIMAAKELYGMQQKFNAAEIKDIALKGKMSEEALKGKVEGYREEQANIQTLIEASNILRRGDLERLNNMKSLSSAYDEALESKILEAQLGKDGIPGANNESVTAAKHRLSVEEKTLETLEKNGAVQAQIDKSKAFIAKLSAEYEVEKGREIEKNIQSQLAFNRAKIAEITRVAGVELDKQSIVEDIKQIERDSILEQITGAEKMYGFDQELKAELIYRANLEQEMSRYKLEQQKLFIERQKDYMILVAEHEAKMASASAITSPKDRQKAIEDTIKSTTDRAIELSSTHDSRADKSTAVHAAKLKSIELTKTLTLEENKVAEALKEQASIVESLTALFGDLGSSIGKAAQGFFDMSKGQDSLDKGQKESLKALQESHANSFDSAEEYLDKEKKIKDKYQKDSTKNELKGYGEIASGLKGLFDKKSTAYKVFDGIEKATHIARMAMTAAEIGAKVAAYFTETTAAATSVAPVVAAEGAKQGAFSITALVAALGAPWPLNIPSFLMVGAILAGLGLAFGGGGAEQVMPSGITAAERQETQGTGTVLGDSSAKSESLSKSLEIMAENSYPLLNYNEKMYKSLQSIDLNIDKLAASLAQAGGITGVGPSAFGTQEGSSKSGNWLTGSKTKSTEVTDTGIRISGTLNALMDMTAAIKQYETVLTTTTKSSWFGLRNKTSTSVSENEKDLGTREERQISLIFKGMADSLSEGIKLLGIAADPSKIMEALSTDASLFTDPTTGKSILDVSLKDLSGEDISNALNGVFSAAFDNMASKIAPWAVEFQKVGEGVGETFVRLAKDAETVKYAFQSVGFEDFDQRFKDSMDGMGKTWANTEATIALTAAKTKQAAADSAVALAKEADAKAVHIHALDETTNVYAATSTHTSTLNAALRDQAVAEAEVSAAAAAVGSETRTYAQALTESREALIEAVGGIEEFVEKMSFLESNFMTEAQRSAINIKAATGGFAALNMAVPQTREAFYNLVEGINVTTEAGRTMFASLLKLAPVLDAILPPIKELPTALEAAQEAADAAVSAMEESISTVEASISDLENSLSGFKSLIESLEASILRLNKVDPNFNVVADLEAKLAAAYAEYSSASEDKIKIDAAKKINDLTMQKYDAEVAALNLTLKATKDQANAALTLKRYVDSLKVGQLSVLTNSEKLAEARRKYDETLALANSGDLAAKGSLSTDANTYLTIAREYYASSSAYTDIFNSVTGSIEDLVGVNKSVEDLLQEIADADTQFNSASLALANAAKAALIILRDDSIASLNTIDGTLITLRAELITMNATLLVLQESAKNVKDPNMGTVSGIGGITAGGIQANGHMQFNGMTKENVQAYFASLADQGYTTLQQQYDKGIVGVNADIYQVGKVMGETVQSMNDWLFNNNINVSKGFGYDEAMPGRTYYDQQTVLDYIRIAGEKGWDLAKMYAGVVETNADVYAFGRGMGWNQAKTDSELAAANITRVPGFAQGGFFEGGLRIVGEKGPELEATGASRIWKSTDLERMLSPNKNNDVVVAQLQVLVEEVKQLRADNTKLAGMVAEVTARSNEEAAGTIADAVVKSSQVRQNRNSTGTLI